VAELLCLDDVETSLPLGAEEIKEFGGQFLHVTSSVVLVNSFNIHS
jgi:hypothetical protein